MPGRRGPRRGAPPLTWVLRVVAGVLVLWFVASAVVLVQARGRTGDGLDRLEEARDQLGAAALLRGGGERALRAAREDFEAAHDKASSPVLKPWSVVPLVNQNVDSVDALTAAAANVALVGERAAHASAAAVADPPSTPEARLALLDELERIADRAKRDLRTVELGPDFFLFGPLGDARDRFVTRLQRLRTAVDEAGAVARGARSLLTGPRRYLVLAANNGEMRAGSGMLLSAGIATFADGAFSVGEMRPTPEFNLPPGAVPLPPDFEEIWGWIEPSQEWRNLATTPRFDVTGPLAASMWEAATGEHVDGVLMVDPVALRALLAAQGPVDAAGQTISAEDVVGYLLLGQYAGIPAGAPEQNARRDQLSGVARAAVDTLQSRPWDTAALLEQLSGIGNGRHVLAWSSDPVEQRAWRAAGIDGRLRTNSLAVSFLNVGANKLDQFLHVDGSIAIRRFADGATQAEITLELENRTPDDAPGYVVGPIPGLDLAPGEYSGILAVNGPGVGALPEIVALEPTLVAGVDGPTKVLAVGGLRLARGEQTTVTIRIRLPEGFEALRVESSSRVPPIRWHYEGRTWEDTHPERIEW